MLIPTIHFPGSCNEAIAYYKEALGAQVKKIAYAKDAPPEIADELPPDFVMYSEVEIFGTSISLSDGAQTPISSDNYTFTVFLGSVEEVERAFNALLDGVRIIEPLGPQFWAEMTGFVADRFGVNWNIATSDALK